ncbi:MAG: transketolase family protein [Actinomycetota bacterium]
MRSAPYETRMKPYGLALLELARKRPEILCLSGDLTRQCEVDIFQEEIPERFIHGGMAEANMIGVAGGLARRGFLPYVHTFGVFATRRVYDQIAMAIAYPDLPVRIVGFMPGISSPGGPSHQAIDDVALMRALPNMTVVDVADATETRQAVEAIADAPGPVYLRLKRGEIPVLFDDDHRFDLGRAQVLREAGAEGNVSIIASGMMVAAAAAAADVLEDSGVGVTLLNVPVIKPLDTDTIVAATRRSSLVITAENHTVIGGLGSAVAEVLAENPVPAPLRRVGIPDVFAKGAKSAPYLFTEYGLSTARLVATAWQGLGRRGPVPEVPTVAASDDAYAPV